MSQKTYYTTIGLEIHAEVNTNTKMFCACKNDPDEERPNVNICPICMGHPGTLPRPNKEAIKQVLRVGVAVGGKLALNFTEFDRKNYFYPDIPKGYQLSQYKYPLVNGGSLNGVELTRVHIEEDTGTSLHEEGKGDDQYSLLNYNRAGVPLMELVTEPVITSAKQASDFAKEFQLLLRTLGASEANLEKGEMRVEANISISEDPKVFGTKVEVKNLNSFKAVEKAIEYEVKRHEMLLEKGEKLVQETRGWDENKGSTFSQRQKEDAHDYRYFPDPDIPKLKLGEISGFSELELMNLLPELPWKKRERFLALKIKEEQVETLLSRPEIEEVFDRVILKFPQNSNAIIITANYLTTDVVALKEKGGKIPYPESLAKLMIMTTENKLSSRGTKDILAIMMTEGGDPEKIALEKKLLQVSDTGAIKEIVLKIIANNPNAVAEYKAGKITSVQFLIGQAMKETRGAANPKMLQEIFSECLK